MVAISEVSAAATVLNQARGFLAKLQQSALADQHQALVNQAMEVVSDAAFRLFNIQTTLLALQQENDELRRQIDAARRWDERLAHYELVRAAGGALVYKSKTEPLHYVCPRCVESKKELHFLRPGASYVGHYSCPSCSEEFRVEFIRSTME